MPIPTQREEQHRPRKVGRARVDNVGERIVHLGRARNAKIPGCFKVTWPGRGMLRCCFDQLAVGQSAIGGR
jgi:hypothetical protein